MRPTSLRSAAFVLALAGLATALVGCGDDQPQGLTLFADPSEGDAPLRVDFVARTESSEEGLTYLWTFGDGSESNEQNPTHTYSEPGDYQVTVRVENDAGRRASESETVRVTGTALPEQGAGDGTFASWLETVNGICAASSEEATGVPQDPNDPEAMAELVEINDAETEAIAEAGLPSENTSQAAAWVDLRNQGSELFVSLATDRPTSADDPRIAELDRVAVELDELSGEIGLDDCRAQ